MKARVTVLTIGVDYLERSLKFCSDGPGLRTDVIVGQEYEHGAVVFFDLESGMKKLALWARDSIAHDSTVPRSQSSPTEFTIGHNVRTTRRSFMGGPLESLILSREVSLW